MIIYTFCICANNGPWKYKIAVWKNDVLKILFHVSLMSIQFDLAVQMININLVLKLCFKTTIALISSQPVPDLVIAYWLLAMS